MRTIELPWEDSWSIIDALRAQGSPSMVEHADSVERNLDQPSLDQLTVRISLSDDVSLRSVNWACMALGIPALAAVHGESPAS